MSSSASQAPGPATPIRRSWRPLLLTDPRRRFRRYFRRAAVGLLAIGLLAGLLYVLFPPLFHPQTHVVLLTGADYLSPAVPAVEFAAEEVAGFEALRPALYALEGEPPPLVVPALSRPEALSAWSEACRRLPVGVRDTLLVYAAAHGVCGDGLPQLMCGSYDPAQPAAGVCSVSELLQPLVASGTGVKVLILDASRLGTDPLAGSVVNEFPELLQREVLKTRDPRLWVLSAAAPLQRSHVSTALQRSVFGYLVTLGLSGAADANQDETVDLAELHRFVSTNADAWAREQSDGQSRQTPVLLNGAGRTVDSEPPVLISTSALPKPGSSPSVSELRELTRSQPFIRIQPAVSPDSVIRPPTPLAQPSSLLPPSLGRHVSIAPAPVPSASSVGQAVAGAAGGETDGKPATEPAAAGAEPTAAVAATSDKPSEAEEASGEAGETGSQPPPPPQSPPLLIAAWQLRDALEDRGLAVPRPVDFAPELWREFQSQLLSYERQVRAGRASDDGRMAAALRKTILPLAEWLPGAGAASPAGEQRVAEGIALRIAQRRPPHGFAVQQPRSLGLAELAVGHDLAALPETLRKQVQQYDELLERGQRDAFDKWLAELPPEMDQFVEFRTARRLGGLPGVAWETIQDLLRVRRLAERIGARSLGGSAWLAPAVERGDRDLLAAERGLLDQIGSDFESLARQAWRQAEASYRAAEADAALIEAATQFSNEVAARAFFYVEFCRQAALVRDGGGPAAEDVKKLFGLVRRLDKLLRGQRPDELPELRQTHEDAQWVREAVERGLQEAHLQRLLQPNPVAGDAQRIETLLSTPLPAAGLRIRLLRAATDVDVELTSAFAPVLDPASAVLPPKLDREDWAPSLQAADLAYALASLAAPDDWEGAPALKDLSDAYEKLRAGPAPGAEVPAEQQFAAHREFGNALRRFFTALPERMAATLARDGDVAQEASRRQHLETLRAALQAGRLADGRSSVAADLQARLRQADGYDRLLWQRQRFLLAISDAPAEDLAYLTDAAAHYRQQAGTVPGQPPPQPDVTPRLEIDGPSALTLTTSDQQEFEVRFRHAGSVPAPVWIVFQYDSELIELSSLGEGLRFSRDEASDRRDLTAEPPSLVLRNGAPQSMRLVARRAGPSLRPTRLVIKATTGPVYVRHRIEIQLPAPAPIELAASGIPNSWTATSDGVLLHPFPNRGTDFQLSLVNRSGQPKSVDVQVRAAPTRSERPLPLAAMSPAEADQWFSRLGAAEVLVAATELALPATEAPVPIAFPKPPEEAPPPKPAAKEGPDAEAAKPAPNATPSVQELLLVITDRQTQQQTIRRIQVEPQRPRRFLQARVGYNLSRQRVEIRVAAPTPAILPPGEIKVRAEFVEPLAEDAERRLDGEVRAPRYAAELYAEVEASPQRIATVQLHVDGYPRAFVFRVPCGSHSVELPEERDRLGVRITGLPKGRNYLPGDSIPVRLQIDAPPGAFDRLDDVVEIGADVDRDRELEGEQVLSLRADRQATVRVARFAPGGVMTLLAQVDDYLVTLPPVGLENAPAHVIARIIVGTRQRWSDAEPVVFDALPPRATRIELDPDRALLHGTDLTVLAWVTDDGLSGIATVEAGLDIQRSGQLAAEPKPAAAYQDAAGRWVAKLATGDYPPGRYTLLVRVTDNLNNSRLVKVRDIRLLTEQEAKEEQKKLTNQVTGTVLFGNQAVPGAAVELAAAEPKPEAAAAKKPAGDAAAETEPPTVIAPVQMLTDEQGRFSFPKVAPGDYRISAKVLLHNKFRQAARDITVPTPPKRLEPLRLEL
ncbi:MAG: hypothetical protein MUE50_03010 [Pirellulaceae bacterium]|nr:hypothetical protein [Pirellulaceae bacterium]